MNTLVVRAGGIEGARRTRRSSPGSRRSGPSSSETAAGDRLRPGAPARAAVLAASRLAAHRRRRRPDRERDVRARRDPRRARRGQVLVDLPYPETATAEAARRTGAGRRRARGARRAGCRVVRALDRRPRPGRGDAGGTRLASLTLELVTAGESHGPALVAVLVGLPAGLKLERGDRRRPPPPPGGLRPKPAAEARAGRGPGARRPASRRHARLAARARHREPRPRELGLGHEPVAAGEGEPTGKGTSAVTLPRPGHADLAGALKYGHEDVRNALERASARQTAAHVAAGSVAKALLRAIGISVAGRVLEIGAETSPEAWHTATDAARADRDTLGGSSRSSRRACRPGSARTRRGAAARRPARRGADGDPGREGRRARRRLRARTAAGLGGARRDRLGVAPPDEPGGRDRGRRHERRARRRCGRR